MDIPGHYKAKTKKSNQNAKSKTSKKRKSDGPTCSMFLADLTRRLRSKQENNPSKNTSSRNIVQTIMDSLTNALPMKFSRKSPPPVPSPTRIETLQSFAPELIPNDTYNVTSILKTEDDISEEIDNTDTTLPFVMPKMPLANSNVFKKAILEKKKNTTKHDQAVNTSTELDVASEIRKHVGTLRKISLIAEEFNQKTAKNLKEIIDSVQEDLIKKLEEAQVEQAVKNLNCSMKSILTDDDIGREVISDSVILPPPL